MKKQGERERGLVSAVHLHVCVSVVVIITLAIAFVSHQSHQRRAR
jgi:hypothetical protein